MHIVLKYGSMYATNERLDKLFFALIGNFQNLYLAVKVREYIQIFRKHLDFHTELNCLGFFKLIHLDFA